MLDIKFIRENEEAIRGAAKNKNIKLDVNQLLEIDAKRREQLSKIEKLRNQRNRLALAGKSGKPSKEQIEQGKTLKEQIAELEKDLAVIEEEYLTLMVKVPTIPSPDTPIGKDGDDNVEIFRNKEIPVFGFKPKNHVELAGALDLIDFDRGTKVAGYRGYYLKNEASLLVMALMNYALNKMVTKGYTPMMPPTLIKEFALFGSGYFKGLTYDGRVDEIYQVAISDKEADGTVSRDKKFLVGTAEPSLLAYYSNEILKEADLPIKLCGFSPCYRSEIGSYGKDTKGLYRVHEFFKVEQVIICRADID
ncbi:MAG: aminoacyl--tRNA ligase-related protein, partial [bacterium]|nr:aminoacyl--tRNA ligase-related protein [bacterium]